MLSYCRHIHAGYCGGLLGSLPLAIHCLLFLDIFLMFDVVFEHPTALQLGQRVAWGLTRHVFLYMYKKKGKTKNMFSSAPKSNSFCFLKVNVD